jgi:type I restriction enzyme S subunit
MSLKGSSKSQMEENFYCEVSLGEVADDFVSQSGPVDTFVYVDIGSIDRESKTIIAPKTLSLKAAPSRAKQVLKEGDVLVSMTRPNLNAVAIVPANLASAIATTGFHVLRSKWVEPKLLYYLVQSDSFIDAMSNVVQGALYPAVRPRDISSFKFHLPSPLTQARIVKKLDEVLSDLDNGVAELKAAQKKVAQYRQSLLKAAVEGELTSAWRSEQAKCGDQQETGAHLLDLILVERRKLWEEKQGGKFKEQNKMPPKGWQDKYSEPVKPDATNMPGIPVGWVWATIDQLTIEQKYGSSSKTSADSDGVPVIRMGNIQDGELDLQNLKYLPVEHDEFPGLFLADGDLLFNRTNSPELVGKTAIYRSQIVPCSYASYLIAVRFSSSFIPEFAAAYINSGYGRLWVKSVAVQQVGQANVNGTKLSALAIPLPSLKEQTEIIRTLLEQLDNARQQLAYFESSLNQNAAQRKNILKAAFSGQLVHYDPHDEPASAMFERIRAEREEREKQPKKRQIKAKKEIAAMSRKLFDVLAEAGDWLPAQEAFRLCGVADGAQTDQVEALYTELRELDKTKLLEVEVVTDAKGIKQYDRLKLITKD